jgi:thiol:disulfide interchange protein DsbD
MIRLLFSILLAISSLNLQAQFQTPITWKYSITADTIPGQYIVEAKAHLERGWHIFTNEPGGDGLLLATSFDFDADSAITDIGPIELIGEVTQKDIEGMGVVNYFENEARFRRTITLNEKIPLSGSLHFQICTDEMCLPPAEELFLIKP